MKTKILSFFIILSIGLLTLISFTIPQKQDSGIKEENITYTQDGVVYKGYIAYNSNIKGKRPAILVVHEWWGLNDYAKMRAHKLAELGYVGFAIDMYGNGKIASNPNEAQELATPFYKDPQLGKNRLQAAINKIKEYPQTDVNKIMAIGYCFGGSIVLNAAKLGAELKGVVSFHGGLAGVPANKELLKAKILVCHGSNDQFVPQKDVETFKHQLDSIGADYTFKEYADATHAFTNPQATKIGKTFNMPIEYNAQADKESWEDMKIFLNKFLQ